MFSSQCQSSYWLRLQDLKTTYQNATSAGVKRELSGRALELGLHLQQMGRYQEAHIYLQAAVDTADNSLQRSRALVARANVEVELGRRDLAQQAYDEALGASPDSAETAISVGLNRSALLTMDAGKQGMFGQLQLLLQRIEQLPDAENKARYLVQYTVQVKRLGGSLPQLAPVLAQSLIIAQKVDAKYLQVEILDQQAQWMEDLQRHQDMLQISDQAILLLQQIDAPELMISIEARRARVYTRLQRHDLAIKSYQIAVRYIEAIRQDIPVSYSQGRSSVREMIDPVYLGLADALLTGADALDPAAKTKLLFQVRDVVEQIKQNQLEDYLGNRCSTLSNLSATTAYAPATALKLNKGTAILYPIIFPDRLELLLETSEGIARHRVDITSNKLIQDVNAMSSALRAQQSFQTLSRRLYKVLLAPLDSTLQGQSIETLVIVPDGALRLLAFAALNDGKQFAVEKYAIAISPGLRIIAQQVDAQIKGAPIARKVLLAGVSEPGKVVDRLPEDLVDQLLQTDDLNVEEKRGKAARSRALQSRQLFGPSQSNVLTEPNSTEDMRAISNKLKQILRLDGVSTEIQSLEKIISAKSILNVDFSSRNFSQQVRSGEFDIVHVASHGIFGSTADKTFILAHDDVITIDQFQSLLSADQLNKRPLDLLVLSACETAEGDDRAPLGISGAALKAKARSAMGSLWPVSDIAASQLMQSVYQNYVNRHMSKAQSLRLAQLELMQQKSFVHPNFWAAFIVVGNWQ
ncbi:CHAT domain-containing protein [Undibacterium sp. LX40W]|uniref:CHAT domain-containing protein n=1 Tax=Undibacterium nitidum TaxID=2762298 RepID=A0A923HTW1_9BURK|nr:MULTISPECIES: CHAT domain-containing protein [Undibacterium]MBC3883280.1 CHAT domain-containing protein [Undibacterium nitidum]MBC3893573.1 CHAT domain-containing protein [Undibacterium sp. LX40W]